MTRNELTLKLRSYKRLRLECERLRGRISEKRQEMYSLRSAVSGCAGIRSGAISDKVERAVEMTDSLVHFYTERITQYESDEREIAGLISMVSDSGDRSILFMHYIEGRSLEEIAQLMFLSERSIWNHRNAALDEICARVSGS